MDQENNEFGSWRNLMNNLEKEESNVQNYLQELIKIRQSLEEKIEADGLKLLELYDIGNKLETVNIVNEFKVERLEKDAEELERKNKFLREIIESVQTKIKTNREKHATELEQFQTEVVNLCELFGSAAFTFSQDSVKEEIEKIYKATEEAQKEYEATQEELNVAKNELDDIVLYRIPQSKHEVEIPLGQRKMVLNLFEEALFKAESRLDHLKSQKASKESELESNTE